MNRITVTALTNTFIEEKFIEMQRTLRDSQRWY